MASYASALVAITTTLLSPPLYFSQNYTHFLPQWLIDILQHPATVVDRYIAAHCHSS